MGSQDSKSIHQEIDKQYKSIRKYYDPLYGEITVLNDKKSAEGQQYALIEKTILVNDKNFSNYISSRTLNSEFTWPNTSNSYQ